MRHLLYMFFSCKASSFIYINISNYSHDKTYCNILSDSHSKMTRQISDTYKEIMVDTPTITIASFSDIKVIIYMSLLAHIFKQIGVSSTYRLAFL